MLIQNTFPFLEYTVFTQMCCLPVCKILDPTANPIDHVVSIWSSLNLCIKMPFHDIYILAKKYKLNYYCFKKKFPKFQTDKTLGTPEPLTVFHTNQIMFHCRCHSISVADSWEDLFFKNYRLISPFKIAPFHEESTSFESALIKHHPC